MKMIKNYLYVELGEKIILLRCDTKEIFELSQDFRDVLANIDSTKNTQLCKLLVEKGVLNYE